MVTRNIVSTDEGVMDQHTNVELPCTINESFCETSLDGTYVWHLDKGDCPLRMNKKDIKGTLATNNKNQEVLLSTDNSLIRVIITGKTNMCNTEISTTNYKNLFVYFRKSNQKANNVMPFSAPLHAAERSWALFIMQRDDFLYAKILSTVEEKMNAILHTQCLRQGRSASNAAPVDLRRDAMDIFPVDKNGTFGILSGEVLYHFKCTKVQVEAISKKTCYSTLPVRYTDLTSGKHFELYMEPITHRLTQIGLEIPCHSRFIPKYSNIRGRWIAVSPKIIAAQDPKEFVVVNPTFLDLTPEQDFSNGGVYDFDELEETQHFMEFSSMTKSITSHMVTDSLTHYAAANRYIGSVNQNPWNRNPAQFLNQSPINLWFGDWAARLLRGLSLYGQVWSVIIGLMATIYIIHYLCTKGFHFIMLNNLFGCSLRTIFGLFCPTTLMLRQMHQDHHNAKQRRGSDPDNNMEMKPFILSSTLQGNESNKKIRKSNVYQTPDDTDTEEKTIESPTTQEQYQDYLRKAILNVETPIEIKKLLIPILHPTQIEQTSERPIYYSDHAQTLPVAVPKAFRPYPDLPPKVQEE